MSESLTGTSEERVILRGDYIPPGLTDYAAIEVTQDSLGRTNIWGLKRAERLSADEVAQAFEGAGSSLEEAVRSSQAIEQLRAEFDDYKRVTEDRTSYFEDRIKELEEENQLLREEDEIPDPRENTNRLKRSWNQATGRLGSFVLRKQVELHNGLYAYRDRAGRRVITREEVIDGYPESSRRIGTAVVIGAAAVAAAVALTYWLASKGANGPEVHREIDIDINGDGVPDKVEALTVDSDADGVPDVIENQTTIIDNQESILENQRKIIENDDWGLKALDNEVESLQSEVSSGGGASGESAPAFGETFQVEPGNGLTHEIQEYSLSNGYGSVTGSKAYRIYLELEARHGTSLIDLAGTSNDTYVTTLGDIRISSSGSATWPQAVERDLVKLLKRS